MPPSERPKRRDHNIVPTPKSAPDDQPIVRRTVATDKLARKLLKRAQTDSASQPAGINVHIAISEDGLTSIRYVELLLSVMEQAQAFGFEWTAALPLVIVLTKL